jgi:polyisoprenoid-binding protein YceI
VPAAAERYRIDADASEVLILIYRDGRMASLGHNHVVAVRQLTGEVVIAPDLTHSSWQLDFPVDALSVDEPQLRAAQGEDFQTRVDDVAIAGTRDHMLSTALLDAARFPIIHLQSEQVRAEADGMRMETRIVVRDHTAQLDLPLALQRTPDELIASGEFDLTHAELGLTPYSVALGALRVAERMHVRYRLVARRATGAPQ